MLEKKVKERHKGFKYMKICHYITSTTVSLNQLQFKVNKITLFSAPR